jgi:hypothetical protein
VGQPRSWVNDRPPRRFFRSGATRPDPHGRTLDTARPEPAATRPYRSEQAHSPAGLRVDRHIDVRSETRQAPSNSNSRYGRGRAASCQSSGLASMVIGRVSIRDEVFVGQIGYQGLTSMAVTPWRMCARTGLASVTVRSIRRSHLFIGLFLRLEWQPPPATPHICRGRT